MFRPESEGRRLLPDSASPKPSSAKPKRCYTTMDSIVKANVGIATGPIANIFFEPAGEEFPFTDAALSPHSLVELNRHRAFRSVPT